MNKFEIVKHLRRANDLWAMEGTNPFRVRAHERSAQAILESPLSVDEILRLPPSTLFGVGPETLAMIRTLQDGGFDALLRRLQITIPVTAAELLRLPGIGPKTAMQLVREHGISSVQELAAALEGGGLPRVPGLGTARLARLRRDLRVFLERSHAIPVALAWPFAQQLATDIEQLPNVRTAAVAGDLRRLAEMTQEVVIVVATDDAAAVRAWATGAGLVDEGETVVGGTGGRGTAVNTAQPPLALTVHTERDEIAVKVVITSTPAFPWVLMQRTGDQTHQQVMEGLLEDEGITWTQQGLVHADGRAVPVADEAAIYALVGMHWLPPEIREGEGILRDVAQLVKRSDIRGDLHAHTTWSDGSQSIADIARQAQALGYEYVAITDHSQSLTIANGLTPERIKEQHAAIAAVQQETSVRILRGTEVDILRDGALDLPDETLYGLDVVIASVHSAMEQPAAEMTKRILRAIEHPAVHIIGHLTGRILGRRAGYEVDVEAVLDAAKRHGVMLELNANPNRLDISDALLRQAAARGLLVPIDTDAHHSHEFANMAYGVRMAQRGWLTTRDVLNTRPLCELLSLLEVRRSRRGS